MCSGRIEQVSRPEENFLRPRTRFMAAFLGQTDIIPSQVNGIGHDKPIGHLNLAKSLPIGTHLDVALCPNHIALNPGENGNSWIFSR